MFTLGSIFSPFPKTGPIAWLMFGGAVLVVQGAYDTCGLRNIL